MSGRMSSHKQLWTMAVDGVDEYLTASRMCLEYTKPDDGCLGYPAVLLLFCVVNALGTYLNGDNVVIDGRDLKITRGEPFRVLNHECFGLRLSHEEIKRLEHSYRNRLAHNAIIEPCSFMHPSDDEPPFVFPSHLVGIRVFTFYRHVSLAWGRFPRERIKAWGNTLRKSK